MQINRIFYLFIISYISLYATVFKSQHYDIQSTILANNLNHPWAMEWIDDNQILITQRNGDLLLLNTLKKPYKKTLLRVPTIIHSYNQGGMLDIKKHPNFNKNSFLYMTFSITNSSDELLSSTALARFKIKKNNIEDFKILFIAKPWLESSHHYGSRIAFDKNNYIYITVGDRGNRHLAQKIDNDLGKVIRLKDDGSLVDKNPFTKNKHIFSYGHRSPQGLVKHKDKIYLHEHGPRGGDELNYVQKGLNYGWPIISYGREYISHFMVGEGTAKEGMQQPMHYWVPSIAPSGLAVYSGDEFAKWKDNFLLGSLKFGLLVRVKTKNNKVIKIENMIDGELGRIRNVNIHNGFIYLLTDSNNGKLIKLSRTTRLLAKPINRLHKL